MKLLSDRHQLLDAFATVAGIPPAKTPKPVLQHVLLTADRDAVTLRATDLEMAATVTVDAVKVTTPGSTLLPARQLGALLREIGDATLTLSTKAERCTITAGTGSFLLVGEDPALFPPEPTLTDGVELAVPAASFASMVRRTAFAAAREETRYAINGVLLDYKAGRVQMVGTDGRRLSISHVEIDGPPGSVRAVCPTRALAAVTKALPDDGLLTLTITDNQIRFRCDGLDLVSQLLDSQFPDYEQVIPKAGEHIVELGRDELEGCLRRVAVLSDAAVRMVRFAFADGALRLSAEASGVGRADVSMPVSMEGGDVAISFNPDYLLDALKVSDLETVRVELSDESTPARFALGEGFEYVLMPISGV